MYRCLHLGGRRERRAALRGGCHDAPPCRCTSQKSASSTSPTTWVRPAVAVARRPLSVPVAVPLRRVGAVAAADTARQLAAHPAAAGVQAGLGIGLVGYYTGRGGELRRGMARTRHFAGCFHDAAPRRVCVVRLDAARHPRGGNTRPGLSVTVWGSQPITTGTGIHPHGREPINH